MTPERKEYFRALHKNKHPECDSYLNVGEFNELLAALEEAEQQRDDYANKEEEARWESAKWREDLMKANKKLAEAQQTIVALVMAKDYEIELHAQSCIEYQQTIARLESELEEMTIDRNMWRSNSTDWDGQEELEEEDSEQP